MWGIKSCLKTLGILAMTACSAPLWAASLQVSPISVSIAPQERAQELWLTNTSSQPIRAQTRVLAWTQNQNKDEMSPTKDIVVSPAITEIQAGARQLIRVIKVKNTSLDQEQTFRLLVDELPNPTASTERLGLQLLLQYSIPVFVSSTQDLVRKNGITSLDEIQSSYQNQTLTITNNANSHIRISKLNYINPNGESISLNSGLLGYVLAHQAMSWKIPEQPNMQKNGKFEAKINMDGMSQILPMP